jgi:signal transduction histidine kinase
MKIKTRLTVTFTFLVAGILVIFSVSIYLFYLKHRHDDFLIRLQNRAKNTATLLVDVKEVDAKLLKVIDDNTLTNMNDVVIIVLNNKKEILYSNHDSLKTVSLMPYFKSFSWGKNNSEVINNRLFTCIKHNFNNQQFYVLATAYDIYGMSELRKLLTILSIVFISSLLLIYFIGLFNAEQSLKPIKELIHQVNEIKANNLNNRLEVENQDEIAELAANFNNMLDRIVNAFQTERMFISNASHELRTPVTSIKGQIEVALINQRTEKEYRSTLSSILDDIQSMSTIINGFLELAQANIEIKNISYDQIRLDEILFSVKEEIIKRKPGYTVVVDYEKIPDYEQDVTIMGNKRLLKILIINLIDNACKFSDNKKAIVKIDIDQENVTLKFIDNGIGIPKDELEKVIQPLYRARNVNGQVGHGIGLSIVQRIAEIHYSKININSEINVGTTVSISFKNNN